MLWQTTEEWPLGDKKRCQVCCLIPVLKVLGEGRKVERGEQQRGLEK